MVSSLHMLWMDLILLICLLTLNCKTKDMEDQGRSLDSCIKWDLGFIQDVAQSRRNHNPEQLPDQKPVLSFPVTWYFLVLHFVQTQNSFGL